MRLPNFLIIGASKSATTTLYQYLCRHPQIYMSTLKEPQFFALDDQYSKGIEWYASLFQEAKPDQICGEASGKYTNWPEFPHVPERLAKVIPHVKLIYIMRHPVDRAYSHYVQIIKWNQKVATIPSLAKYRNENTQAHVLETFEEFNARNSRYLDISNYWMQIEQYLPFFKRESFLFLLMEDLIQSPKDTLNKICRFLTIHDQIDLMNNQPILANQAIDHTQWFIRSRMTAPLKAIPGVTQIAKILPQDLRDGAYQVLQMLPFYKKQVEAEYLPQPMRPEIRQFLLEQFREPNQKLAEFLNRDLSHWSQ